jgi:hypothetical protein
MRETPGVGYANNRAIRETSQLCIELVLIQILMT